MDLELVATDDLIEELKNRFDNFALAASKETTEHVQARQFAWHCKDIYHGIGLIHGLLRRMGRRAERDSRPTDNI